MNNDSFNNKIFYKTINKAKSNRTNRINRTNLHRLNLNNIKNIDNNTKIPKIKNEVYRCNSQPRLFSLIDIKDRFHSKAPSVPNQYKRKIYNNINKILYTKNKNINPFQIPQIEYNIKDRNSNFNNQNKSTINIDKKENEKKIKKNKSQENFKINDYKIQSALISRKERLYKPYCWDKYDLSEIKKEQRDKLMPEGYEFFEKKIMDYNQNYLDNNYIKTSANIKNNINKEKENIKNPNKYILIRKLNKLKQYQSDIFFLKQKQKEKEEIKNNKDYNKLINLNKTNERNKYNDSDIFNLKKEDQSIIEKSGERSYFRKILMKKTNQDKNNLSYNVNNESLIGWGLRDPLPSLLNYTSSKYNLLNMDMPNIGNTKESIFKESKNISIHFNPTHKKKSLCEFIDLSRVSAPNINNDYNEAYNHNPNIFKRKNDINSEYYDIYNKYNSLCDKPFQKFNPINN